MKYYSEMLDAIYDSQAALLKAEKEVKEREAKKLAEEQEKKANRAKRAKEVEDAFKAVSEAQKKAYSLLKDFTKDYGYFHMSYTTDNVNKDSQEKKVDNKMDFIDLLTSFII